MNADEKTCPECAEQVKAAALKCKHCGYRFAEHEGVPAPLPAEPTVDQEKAQWVLWAGGAIIAGAILMATIVGMSRDSAADTAAREEQAASEAKAYIIRDFRDPNSVQFEDIDVYGDCVTGRANAKNAFGAYVGFQNFYYVPSRSWGQIDPGPPNPSLPSVEFKKGMDYQRQFRDRVNNCMNGAPLDGGAAARKAS